MKKKTLAILLSTVLTFSMLTACGNSEEVNAPVTTETTAEEVTPTEEPATEPSTEPVKDSVHGLILQKRFLKKLEKQQR